MTPEVALVSKPGRRTDVSFVGRKTRMDSTFTSRGSLMAQFRQNGSQRRTGKALREIVHGGIISTVLDEAMSKAVAAIKCEALTGELRIRFRHHVSTGESLRIRGWVVGKVKRLVKAEAPLMASDGSERAHAWASFLALPGSDPAT